MKIYDLKDQEGRVYAFEIENMGRRRLCEIVRSFPHVRLIREPKFLSDFREEEFCEFEVNGQEFRAWEPFGDNSRFWIGPEPPNWCEQVEIVRSLFGQAR
jgi:hypothetical protein